MKLDSLKKKWDGISGGVEFHYEDGWYVTIRSVLDPEFDAARGEAVESSPLKGKSDAEIMAEIRRDPLSALRILQDPIADRLIVGWRGLEDAAGNVVEPTPELKRELLCSAGLWGLWVWQRANDLAAFGVRLNEGAVEKPEASSDGSSATASTATT